MKLKNKGNRLNHLIILLAIAGLIWYARCEFLMPGFTKP